MMFLQRQIASSLRNVNLRGISGSVLPEVIVKASQVQNEPVLGYLKNSPERKELEATLKSFNSLTQEVPIVIGDEEIRAGVDKYQVQPHNHQKKLAKFFYADRAHIEKAIACAVKAQKHWDRTSIDKRLQIWERAANLMANEYRQRLNAATILGQSKTIVQAEIDASCELIDFFKFNAHFLNESQKYQPISENPRVTLNSMRLRGIDGFIAAVSPFNFTAIGGNLAYTPALAGNAVVWKPSDTAVLSNYIIFKILREAGVPAGVVNFVPADGPTFGDTITASKHFAGLNFTGSVPTFNRLWKQVGTNIDKYVNFPRLIGECGGKNYHFVHPSADMDTVIPATIRSAFEYNGQKCSACSRLYVPESAWPKVRDGLLKERSNLKMGDPTKAENFLGAVIDEKAFDRIKGYIDHAKESRNLTVLGGGKCDSSVGYFIEPTIVQTTDPMDKIMHEEIFGPVLAAYVYPDAKVNETIELVGSTTPFALTGAIFAQDETFLRWAVEELKMTAGNFYVNDKSTGSVVGQQPFGGGRLSGTNDKAGGPHYVLRWASPQSVKETFVPQKDITYPYMNEN